ncbi:hypothetical protein AB0H76_29920 [Nocardia sp. NPDC050712]|uniref:hypothetical protein n=1 Tax=Nocardia sp. NPDC050712 TaxID=3155518 RepID=UPI0033C5A744
MRIEVVVALISAGVAVCSAAVTTFAAGRSIRLQHKLTLNRASIDRREASDGLVRRYREPILLAAFDLQARLYNIVETDFMRRHMNSSDPEERLYAQISTLYRLGSYFGWIEILRRGLQFMDLQEQGRTHELVERLDRISHAFGDTHRFPTSALRVFRDQQRAIGEIMLEPIEDELRRHDCIGFATFVERFDGEPTFTRWFARLGAEVADLMEPAPARLDRMIELQRALVDLIVFLDPRGVRFPAAHLKRLTPRHQRSALPTPAQPPAG